jgi:hypothetical protein
MHSDAASLPQMVESVVFRHLNARLHYLNGDLHWSLVPGSGSIGIGRGLIYKWVRAEGGGQKEEAIHLFITCSGVGGEAGCFPSHAVYGASMLCAFVVQNTSNPKIERL